MKITPQMTDRAIGAVVGSACGDALGAPYEFQPSVPDHRPVQMKAGGQWTIGEWTDDTSMSVPILEVLAQRQSLTSPASLAHLVDRWVSWSRRAKDVGIQTSAVLSGLRGDHSEAAATASAQRIHQARGKSGGNGSLMRTGPVALGYLDDPDGLVEAARRVSDLTHFDPDAGDASVLWSLAIRQAIVHGDLDLRSGLTWLPAERRQPWADLIDDAEGRHPRHYERKSGWVVAAFQAAWAAIVGSSGYAEAVERAVRVGGDTDTVAAIAGSLAGARWGYSSVPWAWRRHLHGWPGWGEADLVSHAVRAVRAIGPEDWPLADRMPVETPPHAIPHPHDAGVLLGTLAGLEELPATCNAVVSLCRVGTGPLQRPFPADRHATFWLIDERGRNLDPAGVLRDAAKAIATLRAEGRTVYLHCVAGQSRTTAAAVAYAVRHRGVSVDDAVRAVTAALPSARLQVFGDVLRDLPADPAG